MNDQLKDFVERNREEFDHLEAPVFDMQRFKQQVAPQAAPKAKTVSLYNNKKWWLAASVLIAIAATWFIFDQQQAKSPVYTAAKPKVIQPQPTIRKAESIPAPTEIVPDEVQKTVSYQPQTKHLKTKTTTVPTTNGDYQALTDSSSASVRLLAILEIEKSENINNHVLNMLSKTLNHDGNTNVRLAALSVLQKYSADRYTASLLVNALNNQDDPIVQLGLISFLGKMKGLKIDDQLKSIANNPETFAAVRDEAYNVLLNQDKL